MDRDRKKWQAGLSHMRIFFAGITDTCGICKQKTLVPGAPITQAGAFFWRCTHCNVCFLDEDGNPGMPFGENFQTHFTAPCPICGADAVKLYTTEGLAYWRCIEDLTHGPFRDANGKIGSAVGPKYPQYRKQ